MKQERRTMLIVSCTRWSKTDAGSDGKYAQQHKINELQQQELRWKMGETKREKRQLVEDFRRFLQIWSLICKVSGLEPQKNCRKLQETAGNRRKSQGAVSTPFSHSVSLIKRRPTGRFLQCFTVFCCVALCDKCQCVRAIKLITAEHWTGRTCRGSSQMAPKKGKYQGKTKGQQLKGKIVS